MAMGRRKDRARKPGLWIATNELPATAGHPFYQRLNRVLDEQGFDDFVEARCAPFYASTRGRPSLTPGTYFRLLLIGYFEGIDSERGIVGYGGSSGTACWTGSTTGWRPQPEWPDMAHLRLL
jgi:hypothetical protein